MKTLQLTPNWLLGAVSVEENAHGLSPWRLPIDCIQLFHSSLVEKASNAAGVRVAFMSDTTRVGLRWVQAEHDWKLDLVIDDKLTETACITAGEESYVFEHLPGSRKRIEIYLSQQHPITLQALELDDGAAATPLKSERPRWVTYGSSITQCATAESPAQTWPAIVARNKGWDLTCLGYGGQCHLEPMIARMIRDLPADIISLCLGINVQGQGSLSSRTFRSAVIGMISTIREKHTHTPLYLFSPIYSPHREMDTNARSGMSLEMMREDISEAVRILREYGDQNLFYVDGLQVFGADYVSYLPDQLHPNAEGYKLMGKNILGKLKL